MNTTKFLNISLATSLLIASLSLFPQTGAAETLAPPPSSSPKQVAILVSGTGDSDGDPTGDRCDKTMVRRLGSDGIQYGWIPMDVVQYRPHQYGDIVKWLQADGVEVWITKIISRPDNNPLIEKNAQCLADQINAIREYAYKTYGSNYELNLFGYSQGAMVARSYLENRDTGTGEFSRLKNDKIPTDIKRFFSIGGPHQGFDGTLGPITTIIKLFAPGMPCGIATQGFCEIVPRDIWYKLWSFPESIFQGIFLSGANIASFNSRHSARNSITNYYLIGGDAILSGDGVIHADGSSLGLQNVNQKLKTKEAHARQLLTVQVPVVGAGTKDLFPNKERQALYQEKDNLGDLNFSQTYLFCIRSVVVMKDPFGCRQDIFDARNNLYGYRLNGTDLNKAIYSAYVNTLQTGIGTINTPQAIHIQPGRMLNPNEGTVSVHKWNMNGGSIDILDLRESRARGVNDATVSNWGDAAILYNPNKKEAFWVGGSYWTTYYKAGGSKSSEWNTFAGYPIENERFENGVYMQRFEGGAGRFNGKAAAIIGGAQPYWVYAKILETYEQSKRGGFNFGNPLSDVVNNVQRFENGAIDINGNKCVVSGCNPIPAPTPTPTRPPPTATPTRVPPTPTPTPKVWQVGEGSSRQQAFQLAHQFNIRNETPTNGVTWYTPQGGSPVAIQTFSNNTWIVHDENADNPKFTVPAYPISGIILAHWQSNGWLGAPTTNAFANTAGQLEQHFRNGIVLAGGNSASNIRWGSSCTNNLWRLEVRNILSNDVLGPNRQNTWPPSQDFRGGASTIVCDPMTSSGYVLRYERGRGPAANNQGVWTDGWTALITGQVRGLPNNSNWYEAEVACDDGCTVAGGNVSINGWRDQGMWAPVGKIWVKNGNNLSIKWYDNNLDAGIALKLTGKVSASVPKAKTNDSPEALQEDAALDQPDLDNITFDSTLTSLDLSSDLSTEK